jgi:hypothetical protein
LDAIITGIFEIAYREARGRKNPQVTGKLRHIAFMALPPSSTRTTPTASSIGNSRVSARR